MRRRLNLRFLAWFLSIGVIVGLGVHFLHGFQVRRKAEFLRQKAERAAEAGRIQEALGDYRRYLALVPTNGDAWGDYALLLERAARSLHERQHAAEKMDQALRLQPDRSDVRKRLVHVTMDLGRHGDARHHLDKLLETSPDDPDLLHLRGRCLEGTGEHAAAAKQFKEVIRLDPKHIDSYIYLVDLYRHRLGRAEDTARLMDDMVKASGSPRAYVVRARYYRQGGTGVSAKREDFPLAFLGAEVAAALAANGAGADPFAAARPAFAGRPSWAAFPAGDPYLLYKAGLDLATALAAAPDDAEALLESAELERSRGLLGPALRQARRGLEVHPDDLRMYLKVAELCALVGKRSEAIECLRDGMKALPNEPQLPLQLVELLIQEGRHEEAATLLARLKKWGVEPAVLDYLDGRRKAAREEWLEASKALEGAYPALVRWPEMRRQAALLLGKCYEQLGDADQQYGAYRRIFTEDRHDPLWFAAADGVARALLAMNKFDDALGAYRRLIPHAPAARVVVVRLLIVRNLGLPERQRSWDEVDALLAEAVRLLPKSADLAILQAQALAARSEFEKAKAVLGTAEAQLPDDVRLSVAHAGLAEAQGKKADALAILDDAQKRFGDHVELRLARIRHLLQAEDGDAVKSLGRLEEGLDRFTDAEQQALRRALADAYTALGAPAPARRLWEQEARRKPNDLGVRVRLFDLALQMGDEDAAGKLLADMRRLEGENGTLWRYAAAARLVARAAPGDRKSLDEARPLLAAVAARRPGWHRVPVCEGRIEELSGNADLAVRLYLQAIDKGERSPAVLQKTIQLLYQRPGQDNYRRAYEVIRKLPEQAPLMQRMSQVAVDLSLRTRDTGHALTVALKAVADNPGDYGNHLALGRVYWALNRPEDAEKSLRRSVELKDDAPEPWVTLVDFLARTDRKADAEAALKRAEGKLAGEKHRLALAQCYAAVGRLEKAADLHRAALAAAPNDPAALQAALELALRTPERRDEAKQYLERLIALKDRAPGAATGARTVLALLAVADGGDYQLTRETLTSLGFLNPPADVVAAESAEDKRARAVVLAFQRGRGNREEAVRVFEEVAKLQPLEASDEYLLAQLYHSLKQWDKARSHMLGLLGKGEVDPVHVAAYARWLLERDEPDTAAPWVARLEEARPGEWRAVELKARLLAAQKRGGDAADLLAKYAEGKDVPLLSVARLLEQLGHPAAAGRVFEKLEATGKKPDATFYRAGYLARNGRLTEALGLCERLRKDVTPETAARVGLELLDQGDPDEDQLGRVEGWIKEGLRAADKPAARAALQERLATLYNLQGRYQESVDLYRDCLKQNGRDVVAANNLAWMLAVTRRDLDEALALIQRAIDRAGPQLELLDTRAAVYLARGEGGLAVKDLEVVVADRASGPAYFHLAQARHAGKDADAARDALRQALRLGLKEKDLHPLERDQLGRLRAALDVK